MGAPRLRIEWRRYEQAGGQWLVSYAGRGDQAVSQHGGVWITGVGTATPLGHTFTAFADELLAGRSGVDRVTGFDVADHASQIGGQVRQVPCPPGDDPGAFATLPRLEQLTRWCCVSALRDAGWRERRGGQRVRLVL